MFANRSIPAHEHVRPSDPPDAEDLVKAYTSRRPLDSGAPGRRL